MKRTESTDEAVQSNDRVLASGHGTGLDETSTIHQRRRRLVRGAAALAPLVLTLRSGALAAASCTGVKIQSVAVLGDNSVQGEPGPFAGKIDTDFEAIATGDVCVPAGELRACGDGRVETSVRPSHFQTVEQQTDFWTCGPQRDFKNQSVAILSSTSATSMGVG